VLTMSEISDVDHWLVVLFSELLFCSVNSRFVCVGVL